MKKLLMMMLLICTVNVASWADEEDPVTEGEDVEMYDIDPIKEGDLGNPLPRMPKRRPRVKINEHTLTIKGLYTNYVIRIVEEDLEDTVVYNIPTLGNGNDIILLPATLQGNYQLQLIIGDSGYYGYIDL